MYQPQPPPKAAQPAQAMPHGPNAPPSTQERDWWDESASPPVATAHGGHHAPHYYPPAGDYRGANEDTDKGFDWNKLARIIVAIFLPPLGVFFQTGCNKDLVINVLFTLLGYIPGIIHALYVIFTG